MAQEICSIHIDFADKVHLSRRDTLRFVEAIERVCEKYADRHPDKLMWISGYGARMLMAPGMVDDDHPMQYDESEVHFQCSVKPVNREDW